MRFRVIAQDRVNAWGRYDERDVEGSTVEAVDAGRGMGAEIAREVTGCCAYVRVHSDGSVVWQGTVGKDGRNPGHTVDVCPTLIERNRRQRNLNVSIIESVRRRRTR